MKNISKRFFDATFSLIGIIIFFWLILLAWLVAAVETRSNGFFIQKRIGLNGKQFFIYKIKTMHDDKIGTRSSISSSQSPFTKSGRIMRKYKIDELPQLFNVLIGNMSFVGPRPDVPGYADSLHGDDKLILKLRPGITGPASLKYRDEEKILSNVENPKEYNDKIIWPDKVKINLWYYHNHSLALDIKYILMTLLK